MFKELINSLSFMYCFAARSRGKLDRQELEALQSGAHVMATNASAVLADIIEAAKNMDRNVPFGWHEGQTVPEPMEDSLHRFLIRFKGSDPAKAKAVFTDAEAVYPDGEAAGEEFALFTGVMREKDMQAAAAQFDNIIKVIRA